MSERNFQPVSGGIKFISPKSLADAGALGVVLEGIFLEALPNTFDSSKNDFKFELEDGEIVVINHSGGLAYQMNRVELGSLVQISYDGKKLLESGPNKGKESHMFSVQVDMGEESSESIDGVTA